MKIGILQCDHAVDPFRAEFGDYPEMFQALLDAERPGLRYAVYPVVDGVLPPLDHGCDAWVITGSRHSVYDDFPWIADTAALLQRLYDNGERMVGICFGHQLLAHTLGGRTEKAEAGWGVGRHEYRIVQPEAWMAPVPDGFALLASHQDQVVALPDGAVRLAASDFCPNAAYCIGDRVLGFQGHPEFVAGFSRAVIKDRVLRLGAETAEAGLASLDQPTDHRIVARWMLNFLAGGASESL